MTSHYLNQWWLPIHQTGRDRLQWKNTKIDQFLLTKLPIKLSSAILLSFCPGKDELKIRISLYQRICGTQKPPIESGGQCCRANIPSMGLKGWNAIKSRALTRINNELGCEIPSWIACGGNPMRTLSTTPHKPLVRVGCCWWMKTFGPAYQKPLVAPFTNMDKL